MYQEPITVSKDCLAVQIPSGEPTEIKKGTQVYLTQALGGSFTVMTENGFMVRLEGKDAEAIGQEVSSNQELLKSDDTPIETKVFEQLKTCFDPEIPVNIVDLGLIYDCQILPVHENSDHYEVKIYMTLTAPGCGMGDFLRMDVENKVSEVPGIENVYVQMVWDPPWDQSKMTEAAQLQLGML